jgi:hypothetical protein
MRTDVFARKLAGRRKDLASLGSLGSIMYDCDLTRHSSGAVALVVEERPPEIRADKVLEIRRLICAGRYRIANRLDKVVETLLDLYGG